MKKKTVNLRQLALKKSKVASLESNNLTGGTSGWTTGGFQSWQGTAEPCSFGDFGCGGGTTGGGTTGGGTTGGGTTGGGTTGGGTTGGGTTGGPTPTDLCQSHSICPPGIQCY
ncbi:hypothetical protein [Kordia sp.]|uniref:hypothetical protein n=1 Tax=Kordia sp. TaxID=1965332 RepID=UPI003B59AE5E